jgi:hypothetical protein
MGYGLVFMKGSEIEDTMVHSSLHEVLIFMLKAEGAVANTPVPMSDVVREFLKGIGYPLPKGELQLVIAELDCASVTFTENGVFKRQAKLL